MMKPMGRKFNAECRANLTHIQCEIPGYMDVNIMNLVGLKGPHMAAQGNALVAYPNFQHR